MDTYMCIRPSETDGLPCCQIVERLVDLIGYPHTWLCTIHGIVYEDEIYLLSADDKAELMRQGDDRWV